MQINPFIQSQIIKDDKKKPIKKSGKPSFLLEESTDDPSVSEDMAEVNPTQSTNSIFMLQNLQSSKNQKAIRYSHSLLKNLGQLQSEILEGKVSKDNLISLDEIMHHNKPHFNHPGLDDIINDIEVRVAVELAKYPH